MTTSRKHKVKTLEDQIQALHVAYGNADNDSMASAYSAEIGRLQYQYRELQGCFFHTRDERQESGYIHRGQALPKPLTKPNDWERT